MSTHPCPALGRRRLLGLVPVALAAALALPGRAAAVPVAKDAERFVQALGDETLRTLHGAATPQARVAAIKPVVAKAADIDLIGRLVLGRYWRTASEQQRATYTQIFRDYATNSISRRLANYQEGSKFSVTGSRQVDDSDTLVSTELKLGDRPDPVKVDWRVRTADGKQRVIDIVPEGVSMLITNRAQFDSIVSRDGVDGLLRQMRDWAGSQGTG